MLIPLHQCKKAGCRNLTKHAYCEDHAKHASAERPSPTARGYDHRWRMYALDYLQRHPYCCDPYGKHRGLLMQATNVDHEKPHKGNMKLFWDEKNHRPLCASCHSIKTAMFDGGFGNEQRGTG